MDAISTINNTLTNTPLPLMIEKLGLSIANAQAALDRNSINMLQELASTPVRIKDNDYNLLSLGFVPTFYAFTEANIEAKMDFSMSEATSFEVGGKISVETKVIAVSVNANYARKFEQSAQGSSSISARLVSLPPPELFMELLRVNSKSEDIKVTKITIFGGNEVVSEGILQLSVIIEPSNAVNKEVIWSVIDDVTSDPPTSTRATISSDGKLTALSTTSEVKVIVTAVSQSDPQIKTNQIITINAQT